MHIRYGFRIDMDFAQPTSIVTALDVHPSRRGDIVKESGLPERLAAPHQSFVDPFGNMCRRIEAQPGRLSLTCDGVIRDSGIPDRFAANAAHMPVSALPTGILTYLYGSRYCETDLLSDFAWQTFGDIEGGHNKVSAVVEFVHRHLRFGYEYANNARSAAQAFRERVGVCRDFAHLAVTLCRCLNIPARYCNGYLGDIGVPADPAPMDFNAWFQAYVGGTWHTYDARHNRPRIGRILIACGRDAADVAMISSFGPHILSAFTVVTEEVEETLSSADPERYFSRNKGSNTCLARPLFGRT